MTTKTIPEVSAYIDGLATSKRNAEQQLDSAVTMLADAHAQLVNTAGYLAQLTGTGKGPLVELTEYVDVARQVSAEVILVLARLRPHKTFLPAAERRRSVEEDAREGMKVKRLARWEETALREIVVDALGGESKP